MLHEQGQQQTQYLLAAGQDSASQLMPVIHFVKYTMFGASVSK